MTVTRADVERIRGLYNDIERAIAQGRMPPFVDSTSASYHEAIGQLLTYIDRPIPILVEIKDDTVGTVVVEAEDRGRVVYDTLDSDIIDNEDGEFDDADALAQFQYRPTREPFVLPEGVTIADFLADEAAAWCEEHENDDGE